MTATIVQADADASAVFDPDVWTSGAPYDALARLPFPAPGLNVRDALQLAKGESPAHRKLRQRVNAFLQGNGLPNKPR